MVKEEDYNLKFSDCYNLKNYIAKTPTQQPEFLNKNPTFDGRGVKIGIIDGGIDVSLSGLQQTSEGYPKIIDCFDLTGNGHVDTSTVKESDKNNKNILIGLTGRHLKIPKTWKNPSGKWHLGIKSIYELCDEEALSEITGLRNCHIKEQNEMLNSYIDEISDEKDRNFMLKYFDATEDLSEDSLVADCIVWNDGNQWQACIDTSFIGDLSNVKVLTNYRDCHEFGMFFDVLTFCLNIRENGNLLEIYVPDIDHGTIIANICTGYYPNEPEKNGLAPGAQIILLAVCDLRNNGYPSDQNIRRAFLKCIELNVDIINYSIGAFPKDVCEMVKEIAEKHGIITVKAAGNVGPIYSSVSEMEQFQNVVFNIGSCLTSEMKKILYKVDNDDPPIVSSFSSLGPMPKSGGCGITLVAPGHGVTDLPEHYPFNTRLFEATSFACPNAVGAIACLISGLKANSIPVTFFKLKLALINTAFLPDGGSKLAFGNGIIQIKNAFEFYLKNLQNFPVQITNISTSLIPRFKMFKFLYGSNFQNGIFLKVDDKNLLKYKYNVKIEINTSNGDPKMISWHLKLSPNAENFITFISPVNQNNEFFIEINITTLNENTINYAEISGYASSNLSWGPLFHLPITVIIPKNYCVTENVDEIIELNSVLPYRIFFSTSKKIDECFVHLKCLEKQISEASIKIQYSAGREVTYVEDTKIMKFLNSDAQIIQTCSFLIDEEDKVHEICVILKNHKILKKLQFQFQLYFLPEQQPTLISNNNVSNENCKDTRISTIFKDESINLTLESSYITNGGDTSIKDFDSTAQDLNDIETSNNLYTQNVLFENINGTKYFKTTYFFTITKETNCEFSVYYSGSSCLNNFIPHRIQIFTLSKKFVSEFIHTSFCNVQLIPGTYSIKGIFKCNNGKILEMILPYAFRLPVIVLKSKSPQLLKSHINYKFGIKNVNEYKNSIKAYFNNYFHQSINNSKTFINIDPNELELWQNKIQIFYSTHDNKSLSNAVDIVMEKMNAKEFLKNYDKMKNDEIFFKKELIKPQKALILDALFYKADTILNEYLKNCENVPKIFKANFGFELINYNFESKMKELHPSMYNILWSIFTYNIYPNSPKQSIKNNRPQLPYLNNSVNSIKAISSKNGSKEINRKNVKKITSLFLQSADDSDIRKSIIIIKKALIFGNFGTALFYLNKVSTENQTLPNFKIFDEAIIQLLKQLGWKHLAEAHENALLDRHRNYYRMF